MFIWVVVINKEGFIFFFLHYLKKLKQKFFKTTKKKKKYKFETKAPAIFNQSMYKAIDVIKFEEFISIFKKQNKINRRFKQRKLNILFQINLF